MANRFHPPEPDRQSHHGRAATRANGIASSYSVRISALEVGRSGWGTYQPGHDTGRIFRVRDQVPQRQAPTGFRRRATSPQPNTRPNRKTSRAPALSAQAAPAASRRRDLAGGLSDE